MRHRHLDVVDGTPVRQLGLAALDDLLERGDLDDWEPLAAEIGREPWGDVAERVLRLAGSHHMYGTSTLWRAWIERLRRDRPPAHAGSALKALRLERRLTQQELADRLGMTQSEVSRLESRRDVRVSTLRAYVGAAGGELTITARTPDGELRLAL